MESLFMADVRGCLFPDDLFYDAELNLWLKPVDDQTWEIGITEFGGALVGDIYMFNPKPNNRDLEVGEPFALIEVAKTILTVKSPFQAILVGSNEEIQERPIKINRQPYQSWLVHLRATQPDLAKASLLSGDTVIAKANELMDLNRFTSLEEFKKSGGAH
jgi:glycine cleavage system H protein